MRHGKYLISFCLVTGVLCACNFKQEIENGVAPTVTEEITIYPAEVFQENNAIESKEDVVQINEAHFSDETFRRYISEKIDVDGDGALSRNERIAVKKITWDYYELEDEGIMLRMEDVFDAVLDGFEYFPNLERLTVTSAAKVIVKNHSSIRGIGGAEGGIGLLCVENCPALISIGGNMYSGNIEVKNCENMELFWARASSFGSVSFTGTPKLAVWIEVSEIEKLQINADAVVSSGKSGLGRGCGSLVFGENGEVELDYGGVIEWENRTGGALNVTTDFFENCFEEADFSYMNIQLLEKIENIYDEQGRKGWNVCVDLMKNAYSKTAFSLYTEEQPAIEQIVVRPAGVVWVEVLEYSPNRGVSFEAELNFEVIYRNGEAEEVIGTLSDEQYWTILPTGEKIKYRSGKEWWDKGSYVNQLDE